MANKMHGHFIDDAWVEGVGEAAQAGAVMVNLPTAGTDCHVPFAGRKASSHGPRDQGSYARAFHTVLKTSDVNAGQP